MKIRTLQAASHKCRMFISALRKGVFIRTMMYVRSVLMERAEVLEAARLATNAFPLKLDVNAAAQESRVLNTKVFMVYRNCA